MFPSPLLFNIVLAVLVKAIRQQPEIREFQTGKKDAKLTLLAKNMIVFTEIPKDTTRQLLKLINESGKAMGYKLMHGNLLHSYTLKTKVQKEKLTTRLEEIYRFKCNPYQTTNGTLHSIEFCKEFYNLYRKTRPQIAKAIL